jgi:phosphate transport system substrate-binding protein
MKRLFSLAVACVALQGFGTPAFAAREEIRVVGSSTVFPFIAAVAEDFGKKGRKTPVIESTGTGGGMKLFCGGVGDKHPDVSGASRAITASETARCTENGVTQVLEVPLGYDGIVLASSKEGAKFTLTDRQLFLALAKQVPAKGKLIANPFKRWNQIAPTLPNQPILVYGPPPTSGTRDAFVELLMHKACEKLPVFVSLYADAKERQHACQMLREDGVFVEAGENDNLIIQKLLANSHALGIFGYSFLEQNRSTIQAASVNGSLPDFDTIADGSYPIARPLYVYVKQEHMKTVPGLADFARALVSDAAVGEEGYLLDKGLVPLPADQLTAIRAKLKGL